jgi:hypothetical protein
VIDEIRRLLDDYLGWLRDNTVLRETGGWVEMTTPYLDRHNDYLQIFVKKTDEGYVMTDDGYILGDLEQSGCSLDSDRRQNLLRMTLNGFGVDLRDSRLQVNASSQNFAARKHSLLQAMLSVNDLFYLAAPSVASLFFEDVAKWLDGNDIRYTPRSKFAGKSGYDHVFDFVIPKSRSKPERMLQTINHATKDAAQSAAFAWIDTKESRPALAVAYALINDLSGTPTPSAVDAFDRYELKPILWSRREEFAAELAA